MVFWLKPSHGIVWKNLKKFLIPTIIYGDIFNFMPLGIVGDHTERLFAFFPYVQRFFTHILCFPVDTFYIYGELFRAVSELQDVGIHPDNFSPSNHDDF